MNLNFLIPLVLCLITFLVINLTVNILVKTKSGATFKSNRTYVCEIMKNNGDSPAGKDRLWVVLTSEDKRLFGSNGAKLVHGVSLKVDELTDERIKSEADRMKLEMIKILEENGKAN